MDTSGLKASLHQQIEQGDERLLKMLYALVQEYHGGTGMDTADARKKLIMAERQNYLDGKGRSYSWEEVKQMAVNKDWGHAL